MEGVADFKKLAERRDRLQNSFTAGQFRVELIARARAEAEKHGKNPDKVSNPDSTTVARYRKLILPVKVKNPSVQNQRRYEVLHFWAHNR